MRAFGRLAGACIGFAFEGATGMGQVAVSALDIARHGIAVDPIVLDQSPNDAEFGYAVLVGGVALDEIVDSAEGYRIGLRLRHSHPRALRFVVVLVRLSLTVEGTRTRCGTRDGFVMFGRMQQRTAFYWLFY
jgi:hypothetical protein